MEDKDKIIQKLLLLIKATSDSMFEMSKAPLMEWSISGRKIAIDLKKEACLLLGRYSSYLPQVMDEEVISKDVLDSSVNNSDKPTVKKIVNENFLRLGG
jgi:hypothetical protein